MVWAHARIGDHQQVAVAPDEREAAAHLPQEADLLVRARCPDRPCRHRTASSAAGRMARMPDTRMAETTKVTTLRMSTVWTFVTLMRRLRWLGRRRTRGSRSCSRRRWPRSALRASWRVTASSAICAGRKTQPMSELSVASARIDRVGASTAIRAAAMLTSTERVRSEPMSTTLRGSRSASVDPMGAAKAMSSSRTAPQTPTSCRSALAVRPHDDGGRVGPVADHRPGEGQLDPAEGRVDEDRSQGGPRVTKGAADPPGWGDVRFCVYSHQDTLHRGDVAPVGGHDPGTRRRLSIVRTD